MDKRNGNRGVADCVRFWDFWVPQANAAEPRRGWAPDLASSKRARENLVDPRHPGSPMPRPTMVLALIGFALSTSVAPAQIPNLRRKAKDAGRQAVTGEQAQQRRPPPRFDNT